MKPAHFVFWVLSLLLPCVFSSCQGPEVTVVVNRLKPGMLKGKTVGVEGMVITAASWPGKDIDTPILYQAEKVLQHRLKNARVCLLSEAGSFKEGNHTGDVQKSTATAFSKTPVKEPDYIFRIMLRADSSFRSTDIGRDAYYMHGVSSSRAGPVPGILSPAYRRTGGYFFGPWGTADFRSYSWRELNKRVLKAEYTLSDAHTFKLIWRAEAVASDLHVNVNNSVFGFRAPRDLETEVPLEPLFVSMNAAAARTIR